jgi:tRNA threonylcarbamoyl adenosine modification protein YeaZ
MNVLAIDTATPAPAVAVVAEGRLSEKALPDGRRASEDLLPAIEDCLRASGRELSECDRIAVCSGPGSFTGVRVGLATAWGLSRAAGVSVEAVPTLEAMAEAARRPGLTRVAAALDAGRGEVAIGFYSLQGERANAIGASARRLPRSSALEALHGWECVCVTPRLLGAECLAPAVSVASALARSVARAPGASGGSLVRALYSRPSAAEEKRGAP